MLDKAKVIDTVQRYANAVTKEFNPSAIVLYGSYASGTPHKHSDIDVAVVFDGFAGDWLESSSKLWHMTEDISLDIEPILLDSTKDKSGFVQSVLKSGQVIYPR